MKTFATKEKRSAPGVGKARPYVHHPMEPAQQAAMRKILRPDEVRTKQDIGEPDGKYEQETDHAVADLPVPAISGISPGVPSGVTPIQRSENEEPEEELQRQPEEEEQKPIQAKLIQRQPDNEEAEEPVQAKRIQRKISETRGIGPSRFGYVRPEAKAQQAEIRRILRSTGAQAKLTIGQPNDKYEQEADRVVDQVMAMPDPRVQRQSEAVEEEEQLQTQHHPGSSPTVSSEIESGIQSLRGGGQPLRETSRAFFEVRFGLDFSNVRFHASGNANRLARSVNARAFTAGKNIVFGPGEYQPGSEEGKRLMAHELTHTVQRGEVDAPGKIRRVPKALTELPLQGEIIPEKASLRSSPEKLKDNPRKNVIADLPAGKKVRVLAAGAWTLVKTVVSGKNIIGYVSHELIRGTKGAPKGRWFIRETGMSYQAEKGKRPTIEQEDAFLKEDGLEGKVVRVPGTATRRYNCHGFVFLNGGGWLQDPRAIIATRGYQVTRKPNVGDIVVYSFSSPIVTKSGQVMFAVRPDHSGLVTAGSPRAPTEIVSKWGDGHIYKHAPRDVSSEWGEPVYLKLPIPHRVTPWDSMRSRNN